MKSKIILFLAFTFSTMFLHAGHTFDVGIGRTSSNTTGEKFTGNSYHLGYGYNFLIFGVEGFTKQMSLESNSTPRNELKHSIWGAGGRVNLPLVPILFTLTLRGGLASHSEKYTNRVANPDTTTKDSYVKPYGGVGGTLHLPIVDLSAGVTYFKGKNGSLKSLDFGVGFKI